MTYQINLADKMHRIIEAAAAQQGIATEAFIAAAAENAALEAREDAEDTEIARRILADSDPSKRIAWADVKAEMGL